MYFDYGKKTLLYGKWKDDKLVDTFLEISIDDDDVAVMLRKNYED